MHKIQYLIGAVAVTALTMGASVFGGEHSTAQSFTWQEDYDAFGGFSGIEVSDAGDQFWAISDRATIVEGAFTRTSDGAISAVTLLGASRLKNTDGAASGGRSMDAEGLAQRPDGGLFISFEGNARVWSYDQPNGTATELSQHPDFRKMEPNGSLEALAIGPDGSLFTLAELAVGASNVMTLYRYKSGDWSTTPLPRRGTFSPVGADVGPDGLLYILERRGTPIGFQSRIRRFDQQGGNEETLYQSQTGTHDNLEGMSIWRRADGQLIATMISDDNFLFLQITEIVEVALPG